MKLYKPFYAPEGSESGESSDGTEEQIPEGEPEKKFTQDELNRIVQERLEREKKKREKDEEARLAQEQEAKLAEEKKYKELADEREKQLALAKQEAEEAKKELETIRLKTQFFNAVKALDLSLHSGAEDDAFSNINPEEDVESEIKKLLKEKPFYFVQPNGEEGEITEASVTRTKQEDEKARKAELARRFRL